MSGQHSVMAGQVTFWSDRVQAVIKYLFSSLLCIYNACAHTNRYCVGFTRADNIPSSHKYIIACSLPNWKQVLAFAVTAVLRVEIERSGRSRPTLIRDGVVEASILDTATPSKNWLLEALNCRRGTMYCNAATSWTAKQRLETQTRHLRLALKHTHYPLSHPFCWQRVYL